MQQTDSNIQQTRCANENILLMPKQIILMRKNRFDNCEIQRRKSFQMRNLNLENTISLAVL